MEEKEERRKDEEEEENSAENICLPFEDGETNNLRLVKV